MSFTVPGVSGNYASERITFGAVGVGEIGQSFREVTALVEGPFVSGATLELWLPRVADGTEAASARTDADYFNSGLTPLTSTGAVRWQVSAWPGAQIRVKSGGVPGSLVVSASSF